MSVLSRNQRAFDAGQFHWDNAAPEDDGPTTILVCTYCGKEVSGEPSLFRCCCEIGHVREVSGDEE